jgi:hypothetical protein
MLPILDSQVNHPTLTTTSLSLMLPILLESRRSLNTGLMLPILGALKSDEDRFELVGSANAAYPYRIKEGDVMGWKKLVDDPAFESGIDYELFDDHELDLVAIDNHRKSDLGLGSFIGMTIIGIVVLFTTIFLVKYG